MSPNQQHWNTDAWQST